MAILTSGLFRDFNYPSRSEAETAVITRALSIGWSHDQVVELFRRFGVPELRAIQEPAWLERQIVDCTRYVQETRTAFDRQLNETLSALAAASFAGPTGWTDRAVSLALVQLVREVGPARVDSLGLSARDLAERAGVHEETASKALRRLELRVIRPAQEGYATEYDLRPFLEKKLQAAHSPTPKTVEECADTALFSREDCGSSRRISPDVARRHALGPSADLVLGSLVPGISGRREEWSARWRLGKKATERRIRLLLRAELMEQGQERTASKPAAIYTVTRTPGSEDLEEIARLAGTLGASQRQRARYQRERRAYREALERRAVPK